MTESREVLADAMARAYYEWSTMNDDRELSRWDEPGPHRAFAIARAEIMLDALLAHPAAVLDLLENAKCETCGGRGKHEHIDPLPGERLYTCSACGGSGILGRDGVLRALGMEQVGWAYERIGGTLGYCGMRVGDGDVPVYAARVPVPEPSEVTKLGIGPTKSNFRPVPESSKGRHGFKSSDFDGATGSPRVPEPSEGEA